MICPKCQGEMEKREHDGIEIDVCSSCKGVFLDRGELEEIKEKIEEEAEDNASGGFSASSFILGGLLF